MSSTIDERVVEMQFNNQRFEHNVSETISTLDKLKNALKFDGVSKGLDTIEKQTKGFDLSSIGTAVDTISSKFTLMGMVGVTALQNIVNKAVDAGTHLVKAMSIDQVMSGWQKYADKTSSVMTIMAATENTWEQSAQATAFMGTQMEFVNSQMQKLNWFTDETSYNFTDMVDNIGKFTSNQIPLETAVTAMQGIANWAAISGQNAGAASRAMYNLAQAIGVGSVKLMDWRSIENANMATATFKERVLEVAAANGQLTKTVDKFGNTVYTTANKTEVSIENFSQTLSEGWFDKNTLLSVLDDYGSFTNQLYEFSQASDMTATDILSLVEAQEEGTLSTEALEAAAKKAGMATEEFEENLRSLGSEENKFGRDAFKAAQEAKTFQDAIDATKDAASTKWMNIFENIFGDYDKARHVWTDFAEFLYRTLVSPLERLEEVSEMFSSLDGLTRIRDALTKFFAFLGKGNEETAGIFGSLKKGFESILPPVEITSSKMAVLFRKLKFFADGLKLSEEQAEKFRRAGEGLARILQFIGNSIKNYWNATSELRSAIVNIASAIGDFGLRLLGMGADMDSTGLKGQTFKKICDLLAKIINKLADAIRNLDLDSLKEKLSGVSSVMKLITNAFSWVINKIASVDFSSAIGKAVDWIKAKFELLKTFLSTFDWGKAFKGLAGTGIVALIGSKLFKTWKAFKSPLDVLGDLKSKVTNVLDGVSEALSTFQKGIQVDSLKKIATAILLLSASLLILGLVNYEKATVGITILAGVIAGLLAAFKSIKGLKKADIATVSAALIAAAAAMLILAVALGVLAGALALFVLVSRMDGLEDGLNTLFVVLLMVTAALYALSKMSPKVIVGAAALAILAASLLILAAALAAFALIAEHMDAVWEGFKLMAVTLGAVIIALFALSQLGPMVLAGAAAMVIASAALLIMAGAMAAFAAIAGMEGAWSGVGILAAMLVLLVASLAGLAAVGPMVLVGAAALLVAAAACLILAGAVAVVGLALPLLGAGLQALAEGIAGGVVALSGAVMSFGSGIGLAIAMVGEGLGQAVTAIGIGLGAGIEGIGVGIGIAIEAVISSVGKGIGEGISGIAEGVNDFADSISGIGASITSFGDGVRSLSGISWTTTAVGIAEMANALKKVKGAEAVAEVLNGIVSAINEVVPQMTTLGQTVGDAFVTSLTAALSTAPAQMSALGQSMGRSLVSGITSMASAARSAGTSLATNARSGAASGGSWYSVGSNYAQGFINGINDKITDAYNKGLELGKAAKKGAEDAGEVKSPSRVMMKIGGYFGEGFVIGISNKVDDVYNVGSEMANAAASTLLAAQSTIDQILEDGLTPVISPVLDYTNLQDGLNTLYGLNISAGLNGVSAITNSNVDYVNGSSDYTTDIKTLIALNRQLLATVQEGGNVYLDSNVIAGSVNSRLGLL